MRMRGLRTPASKGWMFTPAYGMRITGQQEGGWRRSTGPVHPSQQDLANLGQGLANGTDLSALVNVLLKPIPLTGGLRPYTNSWVMLSRVSYSGSKITTWSTTTAQIIKGSMDRWLLNVRNHNSNMRPSNQDINFNVPLFFICIAFILVHWVWIKTLPVIAFQLFLSNVFLVPGYHCLS